MRRPSEILAGILGIVLTITLASQAPAQESPGLGVEASAAEVAAWDISVGPDGAGLPAGSGTALTGAPVYAAKCLVCHGAEGGGRPNDRLVGGHGTLDQAGPVKTVGSYWPYATTVFDYIRRAMPYQTPGMLSADEVYATTAYLLYVNDIIRQREEMNAVTLPKVRMPNAGNFRWAYEGR